MKWGAGVIVVWTVAGLCACTTRLGVRLDPSERIESAEELLAAMRDRGFQLESLRATGSVDVRRGRKRVKAHMLVAASRPAWLRFETESFFDQPLSILVSDGMAFSFWDMDQSRFVQGAATPVNIAKVIPIFLDGPQVAGIMLGDPPLISYATAELDWNHDQGLYVLQLANERQRQIVSVHPVHLRPIWVNCWDQNQLLYRLSYDRWETTAGAMGVPGKIAFEMPPEKIRLLMKIKHYERNPKLDVNLFALEPPEGVLVEIMEP